MRDECIALACPEFVFAFAIFHNVILADKRLFGCETERTCRNGKHILAVECVNRDVGRQARFQFQVGVGSGYDNLVGDDRTGCAAAAGTCRAVLSQADLRYYALKRVIGIGVYAKRHALPVFHAAYVGFASTSATTCICVRSAAMVNRVGSRNRCHRLPFLYRTVDDHAVDGRRMVAYDRLRSAFASDA